MIETRTEADDTRSLVAVLRAGGPCPLDELRRHEEFHGWSPQRLEGAVARAWADASIYFDNDDDLVAI